MPIGRGGGPDSLSTVEPSTVATTDEAPAVQLEVIDPTPIVATPAIDAHGDGWVLGG